MPDDDEAMSAARREEFRLARRDFTEALKVTQEYSRRYEHLTKALSDQHATWKGRMFDHAPRQEIPGKPAPIPKPFPTLDEVEDAIARRVAARERMIAAWKAMTRDEQNDSPQRPYGFERQMEQKY